MNNIGDEAYQIYQEKGMAGVFDYAVEKGITEYRYCSGCETETPEYNNTCLVCGGIYE